MELEIAEIVKIVVVGYLAYVGIGLGIALTLGLVYLAIAAWIFRK